MKVIAWNIAHQVRKRPIPDYMVDVIEDLEADTVFFNEYIDHEIREPFKEAMREAGYEWQAVSPTPAVHNQIFAASRIPFKVGDLEPPQFDGSAISNFLHLQFDDFPVEMVGIRAPAYSKAADKHAYWAELAAIMNSAKERKILFAGDVNYDPFKKAKQPEAETVPFHLCEAYQIPHPKGDWSFLAHSGNGFKIDHVMHTSNVAISEVEYLDWIRGRYLAGEKIKKPISDHAVLRFEVD
ncbi:endonuclease/exonuclease/phosphatase family protein [Verrucomicrobiales bacterium BCK34]|nr:endonuclease/exonuclease/phosphatase family protein [Verrucomicrobiales bacterium BCK34]